MDFLRLPPPLRRALLRQRSIASALRRHVSTASSLSLDLDPYDAPPPPSKALLTLSPATLNGYNTTTPPAPSNLKQASAFFTRHPPSILFSSPHFRSFPPSPFPEVAFLGRSNVGKSSLLNALFGRPHEKVAYVSKRPGRTRTMNGFGIGGDGMIGAKPKTKKATTDEAVHNVDSAWKRFSPGGIIVIDMPGYGSGSRQEWGAEIMKYLQNRKQLRRTYVLIDSEHGLKKSDVSLLLHLRQLGIAHQIVMSKVDKLLFPGSKMPGPQALHERLLKLQDARRDVVAALNQAASEAGGRDDVMGDILCCSAEKSIDERGRNRRIGVDELRWSVLTACGLEHSTVHNGRNSRKNGQDQDDDDLVSYESFG